MKAAEEPVDVVRGITAVLGALVLYSAVTQVLEYSLVSATAGDTITDIGSYMTALGRPSILAVKTGFNVLVALLTGYIAARIAGSREMMFAGIAAAAVTCSLAWGFTRGEYVALPLWVRALLLLSTGPSMMAGAWIRMQARLALAPDVAAAAGADEPEPVTDRERP